ncbi:MAG: 2-dehydropantoate 2-reductase N-terminal domain-containing protein [Acidiferrobacterales bacterium]
MKILVYGAGVLGSLYAARLKQAGNDVAVLDRRKRLGFIRDHGILFEDVLTGKCRAVRVGTVDKLSPDDAYDLIIVMVRKTQVASVLPILSKNHKTPNILLMVSNAAGYYDWIEAIGREQLLIGFAGAGGALEDNIVYYTVVPRWLQPTTLGELDGETTPRLKQIAKTFRRAGFPVAISRNMDAWQKTHTALVLPMANAIYMAGGDNRRLANMPEVLQLLVRAVREGFQVLRQLGVAITPPKLRAWEWIPAPILVWMLGRWANTEHFEAVASRHANAARDEMKELGDEFEALAERAVVATPAMDRLAGFVNGRPSRQADRKEGQQYLSHTPLLDFDHPLIAGLIERRQWRSLPEELRIRQVYNFVKDEIAFGYNVPDIMPASQILAAGRGECNSKALLFMALLRGCDIPCRFHVFMVDKALQKGVMPAFVHWLVAPEIQHSWVEVQLQDKWINLEGLILDQAYLSAVQEMFADAKTAFCGYAVATANLHHPQTEWTGGDTYVQRTAITKDLSVYDSPDQFYRNHPSNVSGLRALVFRLLFLRGLNANVRRIREHKVKAPLAHAH